jgi:hypothetical protein
VRVDDRFVYCLLHQWVRLCSNLPAILLVFPRSIGSLVQAGYSQQKQQKNQPAPGIQVWQDKRRFPNALHDASQPAPLSQESGTRVLNPKKKQRHLSGILRRCCAPRCGRCCARCSAPSLLLSLSMTYAYFPAPTFYSFPVVVMPVASGAGVTGTQAATDACPASGGCLASGSPEDSHSGQARCSASPRSTENFSAVCSVRVSSRSP